MCDFRDSCVTSMILVMTFRDSMMTSMIPMNFTGIINWVVGNVGDVYCRGGFRDSLIVELLPIRSSILI